MTTARFPAFALLVLGSIALVGTVVLAVLSHPVPDVLPTLATVALSALAGLSIPTSGPTSSSSSSTPDPSPSSTPAGLHIVSGQVAA